MKYRAITCYREKNLQSKKIEDFLDNYHFYDNSILKNSFFAIQAIEDNKEILYRNDSPKYEFNSEEEVIKSLNSSRIPVLLLSEKIVIPFEENYSEETKKESILKKWSPFCKELWPGEK